MLNQNTISRATALADYYSLPVTSTPYDFLCGHGGWGLTEKEYRKAFSAATRVVGKEVKAFITKSQGEGDMLKPGTLCKIMAGPFKNKKAVYIETRGAFGGLGNWNMFSFQGEVFKVRPDEHEYPTNVKKDRSHA